MPYTLKWTSLGYDEVHVFVELKDEPRAHAATPDALLSPIVNAAALGHSGGLSGGVHSPSASSIDLVFAQVTPPLRLEWRMRVMNVANVEVFESSLAFLDSQIASIQSARIELPSRVRTDDPRQHEAYAPLSFPVTDERTFEGSSGFCIEVRFATPHDEATLRQVEGAYGDWFTAINTGAFACPPFPPNVTRVFPLGETHYGDDFLVLSLEDALVPQPESTNCLLNVLEWASAHIVPIASVELYD